MSRTPVQIGLVAAFALAMGDFVFRTWVPQLEPEHRISGVVSPMSAPDASSNAKHLYLRRSWTMTRAPVSAWIKVMGHDAFEVFVNGRRTRLAHRAGVGRQTGAVAEITPLVHAGENTIAIHAAQMILHRPPAIAVTGQCEFADGSMLVLDEPGAWRAADYYDRRGSFWYETEFSDEHWRPASIGEPTKWSAQVSLPPTSVTRPRASHWITAPSTSSDACFASRFQLRDAPRTAWMRLATTGVPRIAVNGELILADNRILATPTGSKPTEWTVELAPYLRAGDNSIAVSVSDGGEAPRLRGDLEATFRDGGTTYVSSDETWFGADGKLHDWHTPNLKDDVWQPCVAEAGYQGVLPRATLRARIETTPGIGFYTRRLLQWLCCVAIAGAIGWTGARQTGRLAAAIYGKPDRRPSPDGSPYVALLLPTVLAIAGGLLTWDLAWISRDVHTPLVLATLVALVPIQWLLTLSLVGPAGKPKSNAPRARFRRLGFALVWAVVFVGAFWLRTRDLLAEPIHHDEVTAYAFTMSIFEHGFPGGQVHPEVPFGYCATSELSFYPNALCALFVEDPLLVIRIPAVFWSMATLALIGFVGSRWYSAQAGLVAGALFAVAPHAIGMADFGRYLAMVQFFALLSLYFAYEAARGDGPLRVRELWFATISFIAMYLSWEGTGIFGIGLALATLYHRRDNLRSVIGCHSLYLCTLAVGIVAVAQAAHRVHQQTQRLWYGEGISSLSLKPMWRYPFFDLDFYLINSSWTKDALLPMAGVAAAACLAVSHRWRKPIRFSLIALFSTALLMSALLPLTSNRYAYHLTEIVLLLTAAAAVAGAEAVTRLAAAARAPAQRWQARIAATAALSIGVALASGWAVRMSELRFFTTGALDANQLKIPNWIGPTRHVRDNFREGDIIVSIFPHSQNYAFAQLVSDGEDPPSADYWLESRLVIQATLGDARDVPLDRRSGAQMLYDIDQVKRLFAEHERVWYFTSRHAQSRINESEVSRYLRQHMDVVYEDFATAVMLRDENHRPAPIRAEEDEAGRLASDYY